MKTIFLCLVSSILGCVWVLAEPLGRSQITAIPAGIVNYDAASFRDVLLDAQKIAADQGVLLNADGAALRNAAGLTITLDADGLSLDTLRSPLCSIFS